jgi:hypothetical protein
MKACLRFLAYGSRAETAGLDRELPGMQEPRLRAGRARRRQEVLMTSSIRPPGAPPAGSPGLEGLRELEPGAAKEAPASGATAPSQGGLSAQAAATGRTGEWLRRLEGGEVTKSEAVEGLVAQALESHGAARLSAAQRAELADVLRSTLLDDPVLGELLGG